MNKPFLGDLFCFALCFFIQWVHWFWTKWCMQWTWITYFASKHKHKHKAKDKSIGLLFSNRHCHRQKSKLANCKTMLIAQKIGKVKKKKLSFLSEIWL